MLLFACTAIQAKDFWELKPYNEWTDKECEKMLQNSPWAREINLQGISYGGGGAAATDSQAPYVKYTVQLQTAPPIRQAIVRLQNIQANYDALSMEEQQRLNEESLDYLTSDSEFVVVQVSFAANNRDTIQNLLKHWQTQTVDMLKNSVYLRGSKGSKVAIVRYVPVSGAAQVFKFVFPRQVNGKDILQPGDKGLQLEFEYPVVGGIGDGRGFLEFKTDKMKFNNEIVY